MEKIRFYITLFCARLIYLAIKLLNKSSGTSFVGMASLKLCPKFLTYAKKYVDDNNSIAITGTNGKTTTSGMLAHIFEQAQGKVIHNVKGANMLTGVANVFALKVSPFKHFDYAVIESDEAYLTKLYDFYKTDYLVVTNLFRDQLDRYGELAATANYIKNAIDKNPDQTLILNADDPLVMNFGNGKNAIYYGFEQVEFASDVHNADLNSPSEVYNCVKCDTPLSYSKRFMAQEGHYYCEDCSFSRPEPDYKGYAVVHNDYTDLRVEFNGQFYEFKIHLIGLYNAYNALASIACAFEKGISYEIIRDAVLSYKTMFGRTERRNILGHDVLIQLIKNPAGASEVLKTIDVDANIVIAINDNYADGRDISWLWDTDFEKLKDAKKLIITSGIRANDMALRLKYAGIAQDRIVVEPDIQKAIELAIRPEDDTDRVTILPSYTALLKINKMKF